MVGAGAAGAAGPSARRRRAGLAAGPGAGAGWGREEQRPALHLQPEGQGPHRTHPRLQLCPALRRGDGDGPAGGGRQPEPAILLAPLPERGPCAGVRGGLGGQVAPADGAPGAARTAGRRAPAATGCAGQQAGQERCPEHGRAAGGAGPAHPQRAAGALPPAHQRDLGQPEHRHQRPPREEPAGHPAVPALSPRQGQTGSHPGHGSSSGSVEAAGWVPLELRLAGSKLPVLGRSLHPTRFGVELPHGCPRGTRAAGSALCCGERAAASPSSGMKSPLGWRHKHSSYLLVSG